MGYIDKNLLAGEQILFRTKKHFIIFFLPTAWTIFALYAFYYMHSDAILSKIEWLPNALAILLWAYSGVQYMSSEFAVTNKRVMMREGIFNLHANEIRIAAISQVVVDQNILGRLLGYGTVSISAFGAADSYSTIAHPSLLQQAINEQLDKISASRSPLSS